MLCSLGDLLDDVVVWLAAPIASGTDTPARVFHRRGGSSANVAAFAAGTGRAVRFVGQVGDDAVGERLVADLTSCGVDVRVKRGGRTGAVVVVVEPGGERTMLSDRGSAVELDGVPPSWMDGVDLLHVTAYALTAEPVASTATRLIATVRASGGRLSVDASSVRALADFGPERFVAALTHLGPDVLFANEAEASLLGLPERLPAGVALAVVKRGAVSTVLVAPGCPPVYVAVPPLDDVADTTGAGDAFAAGFLGALLDGLGPVEAAEQGHQLAAAVLRQPGATLAEERS